MLIYDTVKRLFWQERLVFIDVHKKKKPNNHHQQTNKQIPTTKMQNAPTTVLAIPRMRERIWNEKHEKLCRAKTVILALCPALDEDYTVFMWYVPIYW